MFDFSKGREGSNLQASIVFTDTIWIWIPLREYIYEPLLYREDRLLQRADSHGGCAPLSHAADCRNDA